MWEINEAFSAVVLANIKVCFTSVHDYAGSFVNPLINSVVIEGYGPVLNEIIRASQQRNVSMS